MSLASTPRLHESRCTRYRFRYSECRRCADACPHDAIAPHDSGVRIDADRCRDCALCVDACHTGTLETPAYAPIAMLRSAIRQPAWRVACGPSGAAADAVVPCLGALGPVILAYFARRGIALTLSGAWHCNACPHGRRGGDLLVDHLRSVGALCDAVWRPGDRPWTMPALAAVPEHGAYTAARWGTAVAPSRRRLFRRLVQPAVDATARGTRVRVEAQAQAGAIRAGAWHVPEQRDLLQIVCKRNDDQPVRVPLDEGLPLMELGLKPGCTACEACFRVCPTGALAIEENPDEWGLVFQTDRCVGCQACLEACQPRVLDAAAVADARPERAPLRLMELVKQRCTRCDRHFATSSPQRTCPVCSDDEAAFSEIFG